MRDESGACLWRRDQPWDQAATAAAKGYRPSIWVANGHLAKDVLNKTMSRHQTMTRTPHLLWPLGLLFLCSSLTASAQFDTPPRSLGRGSVEAVLLSPDGQLLISSGSDGMYVYDANSLNDIGHLQRHDAPFHRDVDPVFSPNSRLLAMGYADTTVVIWDMQTLTELASLSGHVEWITALAFSQDGSLLATGDRTGRMKVWSTVDWSLQAQGQSDIVRVLLFRGNEQLIASNGFRAIRIWRLPDFVEVGLLVHEDNVGYLHLFADGRRLLSGAADYTARIWDIDTGEQLLSMRQPGNATAGIMISAHEQYAVLFNASSSYQGTHVWRLDPPEEIAVFQFPDSGPLGISGDGENLLMWSSRDEGAYSLLRFWNFDAQTFIDSVRINARGRAAFDADRLQLSMISTAGVMERVDLQTASVTRRQVSYLQRVADLAFSPGGEWLAAAFSRTIHIWDVATGATLMLMDMGDASVDRVSFSADCRDLYIEHLYGMDRRSLQDPTEATTLYDGFITRADFAPAVERAALGWRQGNAAVIDLRRGTTTSRFEGHADDLSTIALSDDGSLMAVSGEWRDEPEAWLWRVADQVLLGRLPVRRAGVSAFDFSPDNRLLAASGWYDGIQLWDTESLTLVDSIETLSTTKGISFSPDGEWFAWSEPGAEALRLLELETGRRVVGAPTGSIFSGPVLEFAPTQGLIAIGGWAGRVRVWDNVTVALESSTSPCADVELASGSEEGSSDTVVAEPGDVAAPTAISLSPGRPNPLFSGTSIAFGVPSRALVRLEIYNMQGQVVRVLVDDELDLGRYEQQWNGRDRAGRQVASGVYLIRLHVGNQILHGKLLRVR